MNEIVEDLDRSRLQELLECFSAIDLPDSVVNDLRLGLWRLATSTFSDAKSSEVTSMLESMQDTIRNWSSSTQIESFGDELRQNRSFIFLIVVFFSGGIKKERFFLCVKSIDTCIINSCDNEDFSVRKSFLCL